ncbi:MAG: spore coat polysaccharide biosynthesis protein SpsF [Phenylobacterium sp.]|jgi:spore coat polysaccharide biosynthesis protein SpsF
MNIAILQARMSSTRLPGKVLMPIVGQPMLALQIERLRRAKQIDKLVVATSNQPEDNAIAQLCQSIGVECYQGSLDNVLDRFYQIASKHCTSNTARTSKSANAADSDDHIIRLTADCPLACPIVLDEVVAKHIEQQNDYTTNAVAHSYLDGLDVEVLTFRALQLSWQNATTAHEKEHVTPYVIERPQQFSFSHISCEADYSKHRWTVDYFEDFELVKFVYESLYSVDNQFSTDDVLQLLAQHPDIYALNQQYVE